MADGTNHMTSHDNDDEGQRRKRHRGLILRLKQKKNCKSELKKFSSVTLFSSVYIQCFSILHSNHESTVKEGNEGGERRNSSQTNRKKNNGDHS